jgi:hypothetical protein
VSAGPPPPRPVTIPTFIPTTRRTGPDLSRPAWNIVAAQRTFPDVSEQAFGNYTLFEGTSEIQRLVISRALSGLHIR